jgi:branched-subunit amino acid aminotransferase/4-amino-4-deoxychorismate lyase
VFVVREGGDVVTPPLAADVLPGVTRAIVLGLCAELGIPVREATVPLEMLRSADEVFVTNSVQEVLPLSRVAGRAIPGRALGLRLLAAYRARVTAG